MTLVIACAIVASMGQTPAALADQSKLKADFNRAKGKVRIVMLVSPT